MPDTRRYRHVCWNRLSRPRVKKRCETSCSLTPAGSRVPAERDDTSISSCSSVLDNNDRLSKAGGFWGVMLGDIQNLAGQLTSRTDVTSSQTQFLFFPDAESSGQQRGHQSDALDRKQRATQSMSIFRGFGGLDSL